jgi:hypothetical protein
MTPYPRIKSVRVVGGRVWVRMDDNRKQLLFDFYPGKPTFDTKLLIGMTISDALDQYGS